MTEDQRTIILTALRAAESHLEHCCGHCTGDDSVDRIQVRDAIKALGEQTAEDQRHQEYLKDCEVYHNEAR